MAGQAEKPGAVGNSGPTASRRRRPSFQVVLWCATLSWLTLALSVALLWGQHRAGVLHPVILPFVLLLTVTVLAALIGTMSGVWRTLRGPRRRVAATCALTCFLPLSFWIALGIYTLRVSATGAFPKNVASDLAGMAVASLMEGEAHLTYPHRLESQRLVMFYDDRITEPHDDLKAMDRHVADLEAATGKSLRARIHWVRGEVFGRRQIAIRGLVLGSSRSPAETHLAEPAFGLSVDRHELAHAVVHQLQPADADPPTLLIEGWAETHSGLLPQKQAEYALQSRRLWRDQPGVRPTVSYLRELTGETWYHRVDGPVYSVGAPFAGYILRTYGTERFLRLYFACRPGRFAEECQTQLGVALDDLESAFWVEVERLAGENRPPS